MRNHGLPDGPYRRLPHISDRGGRQLPGPPGADWRRLAPIGPIRVVDAIAIQDAIHHTDVIRLDLPATAHPACGSSECD